MRISDIYKKGKMSISFEIFPPKGDLAPETLTGMLDEMSQTLPDFISVTYSAGGSGNSEKTVDIADMIKNRYGIESMAHLTCINADKEKIRSAANELKKRGIENVFALRGDRTDNSVGTDFRYAKDLIRFLSDYNFCIGAACYPEGHIECDSMEKSIEHLKEKEDAGAGFFISQLFFDNDYFYRFREAARGAGIKSPLDAGVMPMLSKSQISRMIFMCGASLPSKIVKLLYKYENDPASLRSAGIEYATEQLLDLQKHGVDGVHIYTMNCADIAKSQTEALRIL